MGLLTTLAIVILFLFGSGLGVFWYYRKILREAKNYERGLKMIPLLIHLPPASDDLEVGGRDTRDVVEETISHAQVLYNIVSSTATKGFKSNFYGQRHLAFEIVANKGLIHYYVAVPIGLIDVVKQAVVAAYPTARLEEASEHNIFSPVGKITGTIGGELSLKKSFAYPIATYQETKRDTMQALLNALSALSEEDGAGVQILLRPAGETWTKSALAVASKKKKDKGAKGNITFTGLLKEVAQAPFKAPEAKEAKPEDKQLSSLEQAHVDSIEEKTRHPGYEVLIRVIASSNTAQRSQTILKNIIAAFALFDAPGRNGFKFSSAKSIEEFVTAFIFRFFPPEIKQNILNSVELATIFHLPDQRNTKTSQLQRQNSKQVDGPQNVPKEGLLLGYNIYRGTKKEIRIDELDRRRHVYIVGQTGTGKSSLLENLALQDMLDGKGFAFIDPHGDVAEALLNMVPKERIEDVIYFSPGDMEYPMGLNLFEFKSSDERDFLVQEAINMLYKLYDPQHTGIMGPRYESLFRNVALTVMADPAGSSFIDIPKVFTDKDYQKEKMKHVTDQTVLDFWNKEMAQTNDYHKSEVMGWFVSKFGAFLSNEMMRNIIGQTKSAFNLRDIMDNKKILLVNLSKGKLGDLNQKLLGMIFVMKFQVAAMSRVDTMEEDRQDFTLYVDEFQNFATDSFAEIFAEARKFRLSLVVANQFMTQLTDQVREAVIGNVGTVIALRLGTTDAEQIVKKFAPVFDIQDLVHLPNFEAIAQVMIHNVPSVSFSMSLIPRLGHPNPNLGNALKKLSSAKYGRPRATVEKEIFDRLASPPSGTPSPLGKSTSPFGPPPAGGGTYPSYGSRTGTNALPAGGGFGSSTMPASDATGTSFLDDWLAKRPVQKPAPAAATSQSKVAENTTTSMNPAPKPQPKVDPLAEAEDEKDELSELESEINAQAENKLLGSQQSQQPSQPAQEQPQEQVLSVPKPKPAEEDGFAGELVIQRTKNNNQNKSS
ncbi:MAG TPA: ATP-binding protein [Candidatus Saccharimonadales bacterium]|nr:ATP-binding protein [Candidatus Saccharimonadales bacterium]